MDASGSEKKRHPLFKEGRDKSMKEIALVIGIVAVWVLLQTVVLPYFGVST